MNKKYYEIINICKEKRYYAMKKEMIPTDEYLWLLGIDVVNTLKYGLSVDLFVDNENNVYSLMGIDIQIDYEHKDIIKLYREA